MNDAVEQTISSPHQVWDVRLGCRYCCPEQKKSCTKRQRDEEVCKGGCVWKREKGIWQKNSRSCLQIPAAWRREGKCFCACVPSLKFPGGTEAEITLYKQEREWAERKTPGERRRNNKERRKLLGKDFIHSHKAVWPLRARSYIPRDAVMMWHPLKYPVICRFPLLGSLLHLPAPKSLSLAASQREWNSP